MLMTTPNCKSAPDDRPTNDEQRLLLLAIAAGALHAQLGQGQPEDERCDYATLLSTVEAERRALKRRVAAAPARKPWWRWAWPDRVKHV